eukprot:EG_transcript_15505
MSVPCESCRDPHYTQNCPRTAAPLPPTLSPAALRALYAATTEMKQLAKDRNPEGVRRIVAATTYKDGWFLAVAAKAFRELRCWEDLNSLWQESSNSSLLDDYNCNQFLLAFLESGNEVQLLEVLRCIREKRIQKNYLTHALVMKFCVQTGETDIAEKLFHEKLSLGATRPAAGHFEDTQLVKSYNSYLTLLAGQNRWDEVETAICEPLLRWNGDGLLMMEAVVRAMRESRKSVCAVMYYVLIRGYAEKGQLQDALRTLNEAEQRPEAMVAKAVYHAHLKAALALAERMASQGA